MGPNTATSRGWVKWLECGGSTNSTTECSLAHCVRVREMCDLCPSYRMRVVGRLLPFAIPAYFAKCSVMFVLKRSRFTNPLSDIPAPAPEAQPSNNPSHHLMPGNT